MPSSMTKTAVGSAKMAWKGTYCSNTDCKKHGRVFKTTEEEDKAAALKEQWKQADKSSRSILPEADRGGGAKGMGCSPEGCCRDGAPTKDTNISVHAHTWR